MDRFQLIKNDRKYYILDNMTGGSVYTGKLEKAYPIMQRLNLARGAGFFDKAKNVFTNSQSNDVEEFIKRYGALYITGFAVHRVPVQAVLTSVLKVISLGKFDPKSVGYDQLYHLFIVFQLYNPMNGAYIYVLSEKRPVLIMEERKDLNSPVSKGDFMIESIKNNPITFADMIAKTKQIMGPDFQKYDARTNNCQRIIASYLHALNPSLVDNIGIDEFQKLINFTQQDVTSILTGTTHKISRGITDLGALVGRVVGGEE